MDSPQGNSLSGENVVGFQLANSDLHVLEPMEQIQIPVMEAKVRESAVIWLVNDMSGDDRIDRSNPPLDLSSLVNDMSGDGRTNRIKPPLDPSRLKTRICYNWDLEGYGSFGSKCHFAHGAAELRPYSGRLRKKRIKGTSVHDAKQGAGSSRTPKNVVSATGASSRRFPITMPKRDAGPRRSKGPNKISKIYGDWINDLSGSSHHS